MGGLSEEVYEKIRKEFGNGVSPPQSPQNSIRNVINVSKSITNSPLLIAKKE
jgi:hypothetical protein